jgi:hypothetical protein
MRGARAGWRASAPLGSEVSVPDAPRPAPQLCPAPLLVARASRSCAASWRVPTACEPDHPRPARVGCQSPTARACACPTCTPARRCLRCSPRTMPPGFRGDTASPLRSAVTPLYPSATQGSKRPGVVGVGEPPVPPLSCPGQASTCGVVHCESVPTIRGERRPCPSATQRNARSTARRRGRYVHAARPTPPATGPWARFRAPKPAHRVTVEDGSGVSIGARAGRGDERD